MAFWKELVRRAAWLRRRSHFEQDLAAEIQFHIDTHTDELEREGCSRAEARCRALREFGSPARACEETRSAWQFRWLEELLGDVRYAARAFRRNPAFALIAVGCLALGVGANTTIFSVAMEVLFNHPSCRDSQSLVQIRTGGSYWPAREYRFLRDAHAFDGVAGMNIGEVVNWRDGENSYRLAGTRVTDNFFDVTGVPVALGRPIQSGESHVAVLTHGFWSSRLGADRNVIGRRLFLDGWPYTVVGVLPREHRNLVGFGFMPDLYLTLESSEYLLYARLPDGAARQAAYARLTTLCRELDRVYPDGDRKRAREVLISSTGGLERLRAEAGEGWTGGALVEMVAFFGMLVVVAGLVLLIACANVSSLLLARGVSRSHEFAIRASLGGSRARIIRHLLAESLVLAVCGTGTGLLLNLFLTRAISNLKLSVWLPLEFVFQPDRRLLVYSAAIAAFVTLASGMMPAFKSTRAGVAGQLKQTQSQLATGRWALGSVLVVCQLAVSMVLLSGGWIFFRNLLQASSLDPGFDTGHTVWARFRAVPELCTPQRFQAITAVALERLQVLPGIDSAALARAVPLQSPYRGGGEFRPDGAGRAVHAQYNFNAVGPDDFRTMNIPIVQGRAFLESDRTKAQPVAILNRNLARRVFGSTSAVGHVLRLPDGRVVTVVGIARNSKYFMLGEDNPMALYVPWSQKGDEVRFAHFLLRTKGSPEATVHEVNRLLAAVDTTAAVEVQTMRDALQFTLLPSRVGAAVLGCMALLGLVLASVGLYGVLQYAISRRIREIGVRVALGATPYEVLRVVAGQSGRLVGAGLVIGLFLSVFAVRPLAMFLAPQVRPADPMNFVVVACALLLVAAAATITPVLRALRVDPAVALRHEQ